MIRRQIGLHSDTGLRIVKWIDGSLRGLNQVLGLFRQMLIIVSSRQYVICRRWIPQLTQEMVMHSRSQEGT